MSVHPELVFPIDRVSTSRINVAPFDSPIAGDRFVKLRTVPLTWEEPGPNPAPKNRVRHPQHQEN